MLSFNPQSFDRGNNDIPEANLKKTLDYPKQYVYTFEIKNQHFYYP